jgi:multidrug efflux pump subunit AcrA (membrane-fusion protein)
MRRALTWLRQQKPDDTYAVALQTMTLAMLAPEADRAILDGTALEADDQARGESPSASAKAEAEGERKRRHVWVVEPDGLLRGIPVTSGIGDHRFTEIVSGDVEPGQKLVVGVAPKDD